MRDFHKTESICRWCGEAFTGVSVCGVNRRRNLRTDRRRNRKGFEKPIRLSLRRGRFLSAGHEPFVGQRSLCRPLAEGFRPATFKAVVKAVRPAGR
jgi:hypothetical protein